MLQLLYRDYHISKQNRIKKAVFISFKAPVTDSNFNTCSKQLKELLQKKYDSYIFYIQKPQDLYSHTLKLMLAFSNTYPGNTGLLLKNTKEEVYESLKMENIFVINSDMKTLLVQLERLGRK